MTGRKTILKWLGVFFALMLGFTVISRAADSVNVAAVQVRKVQNQLIVYKVRGTGKIEGSSERAVFALEGLRVQSVLAKEGQPVNAGDVLLEFSPESIEEAVRAKEAQVQSLSRKVEDLQSAEQADTQKKNYARSRAQENYNTAVYNGDINIANARNEVNQAKQKLEQFYAGRAASQAAELTGGDELTDGETELSGNSAQPETENSSYTQEEEQALMAEIRAKEEALNQAIVSKNQDVTTAAREIQDAGISDGTDGSLADAQEELSQVQKELDELISLQKSGGVVAAPADGVVKAFSVTTGGQTTGEAAAVLYERGEELYLTGKVTKDEAKYVEIGGKAEIEGGSGQKIQGEVEGVAEEEGEENMRRISIRISGDALSIGETAEFTIEKESGPYTTCVPLSALRQENGTNFVYVTDTENTVLGEVLVARRLDVTVKEKNEAYAALEEGSISTDQKVIIDTDREITDGGRVRLQDS